MTTDDGRSRCVRGLRQLSIPQYSSTPRADLADAIPSSLSQTSSQVRGWSARIDAMPSRWLC